MFSGVLAQKQKREHFIKCEMRAVLSNGVREGSWWQDDELDFIINSLTEDERICFKA